MEKPTQTEIAAELGISKASLSKLKKLGMPVESADAARAWRARYLHPGRVRSDPGPSPRTLIERAMALVPLAREALRGGRFDLVAGELKLALQAIPASHREAMRLDLALWWALIGPAMTAELQSAVARQAVSAVAAADPTGTIEGEPAAGDADSEIADGEFAETLYALACGELRLLPAAPKSAGPS